MNGTGDTPRAAANERERAVLSVSSASLRLGAQDPVHVPLGAEVEHCSIEGHAQTLMIRGWRALTHVVDETRQSVLIHRGSAAQSDGQRQLSRRELQVTYLAALGLVSKRIAAVLGLSHVTVRSIASQALRKLGFRTSTRLPAFWHALAQPARRIDLGDRGELIVFEASLAMQKPSAPLTAAECNVLHLVLGGLNNHEIATERRTSERTVANQVSVLFQKFGVCSKIELAARALGVARAREHTAWLEM